MNNYFSDYNVSQCLDFYLIQNSQIVGPENNDLFIGQDITFSMKIPNGTSVPVRDIVVLGELLIRSTDENNKLTKGNIVARNIFVPGTFKIDNINMTSQNTHVIKTVHHFRQMLQDILLDWFSYQKESARKMGLESILK